MERARTYSTLTFTLTHTPAKALLRLDLRSNTKEVGREQVNKHHHTSAQPSPPSFRREILEAEAKMEKVAGGNRDRISVNCCN